MTDCNECGNIGYTLKTNDEGVEYMDSCHECFVAAHEADHADAIKADHCSEDDRGHEFEFAAHRCTHCNQVHPSLREAA